MLKVQELRKTWRCTECIMYRVRTVHSMFMKLNLDRNASSSSRFALICIKLICSAFGETTSTLSHWLNDKEDKYQYLSPLKDLQTLWNRLFTSNYWLFFDFCILPLLGSCVWWFASHKLSASIHSASNWTIGSTPQPKDLLKKALKVAHQFCSSLQPS